MTSHRSPDDPSTTTTGSTPVCAAAAGEVDELVARAVADPGSATKEVTRWATFTERPSV